MDELTRHLLIPGAEKQKDLKVAAYLKNVFAGVGKSRAELEAVWLRWVGAFEGPKVGPPTLNMVNSARRRELHSIISVDLLENQFMVSSHGDGEERLVMDESQLPNLGVGCPL